MTVKDFWTRVKNWATGEKLSRDSNYQPEINDEGLISENGGPAEPGGDESQQAGTQSDKAIVKTVQPAEKQQSLEKLQEGFNNLIKQLQDINKHLNRQAAQSEDLMNRMEQLPKLLESFPDVVQNQKQITEGLIEQLKTAAAKDQQFLEAVEKIPTETAKQTDALVDIDHQLAAAADTDVQMAESLNKFNEALDKLKQSTVSQTDGIMQMSKTFATSDRYLKYILSKQNRRFVWVFIAAIGVCVLAILILTGIVIYLRQY